MLKNRIEFVKFYQYKSVHTSAHVIIKQYMMMKYVQLIIQFAPLNMFGSSISLIDLLIGRLKPFNLWSASMSEFGLPRWGSIHTAAARTRHNQPIRRSKHHWATHRAHLWQPSLWTNDARNTNMNTWAVVPCRRPKLFKYICTHASVRSYSTDSCSRTFTRSTM